MAELARQLDKAENENISCWLNAQQRMHVLNKVKAEGNLLKLKDALYCGHSV